MIAREDLKNSAVSPEEAAAIVELANYQPTETTN